MCILGALKSRPRICAELQEGHRMTSEREIYLAAAELMNERGGDARRYADQRRFDSARTGDSGEANRWRQISLAVSQITSFPSSVLVH